MDLSLIIHYDKSYLGIFKDIPIRESEKLWRYSVVNSSRNIWEAPQAKLWKSLRKLRRRGVLFVDETYTLCAPSARDFGKEAVETLMANVNNNVNPKIKNPVMIVAGYKEQMNDF